MDNVIKYLDGKWKQLTAFSRNEQVKQKCWKEIVEHYTRRNRFYHNLNHIGNIFLLFDHNIALAKNPALIGFAIFYHDLVYDTLRSDNEEQSALKAREHMQLLKVKASFIEDVVAMILSTKTHAITAESSYADDMALFLDLDLSVLAEEWNDYEFYRNNIRKEFQQYPDQVYKSGRKNALQQILSKDKIFHTSRFREALECKARENVNREISLLGNTL